MPAAISEAWGPSQATGASWSENSGVTEMSVGTAVSQLSDWPRQPRARQAMMKVAAAALACGLMCDEQQECWFVDDLQHAAFAWQQLGAADAVLKVIATFTTFCDGGRPPASWVRHPI
jgi:hypothetical protein